MRWVLIAALPIGVLIGVVGIGGLLLPAALGQVTGDAHLAAGTSSLAFLFTGLVASAGLLHEGRLERRTAVPVGIAAAPGAAIGAVVAGWLPGTVMVLLLVPPLLALGLGVRETVRLALFVQVPIVVFAVAGYAAQGDVAWGWGTAYGVIAAAGVLAGMALGRRIPPERLRLAAVVLVLTGIYLVGATLL